MSRYGHGQYVSAAREAQMPPDIRQEWEEWLTANFDGGHYESYKERDPSVLPYVDGKPQWVVEVFMPEHILAKWKATKRAKWTQLLKNESREEWGLLFNTDSQPIAMARSAFGIILWSIPILNINGAAFSIERAMAMCHSELVAAGFEHLIDPPPEATDGA